MKAVSAYIIFLGTFCCFGLAYASEIAAMELNIRGSPKEVQGELYSVFPIGMSKREVVSIAKSKLELKDAAFRSHDYGANPLVYRLDGKDIQVYSWIKMNLGEYRSIRFLFFRTLVSATFSFDDDDNLIEIEVEIGGDSL